MERCGRHPVRRRMAASFGRASQERWANRAARLSEGCVNAKEAARPRPWDLGRGWGLDTPAPPRTCLYHSLWMPEGSILPDVNLYLTPPLRCRNKMIPHGWGQQSLLPVPQIAALLKGRSFFKASLNPQEYQCIESCGLVPASESKKSPTSKREASSWAAPSRTNSRSASCRCARRASCLGKQRAPTTRSNAGRHDRDPHRRAPATRASVDRRRPHRNRWHRLRRHQTYRIAWR